MTYDRIAEFRRLGLAPKKAFGQNFLTDRRTASAIAAMATTPPNGTVIEIGAGLGALTEPLLERAALVIAIERDRDLCPILAQGFAPSSAEGRFVLLEADAKSVDYRSAFVGHPRPHVLAGNLPYQITGPLLETATELSTAIDLAVFMVQAEVADRLCAPADTEDYGALSVFVSAAFQVERALRVGRGSFVPSPNVDSAVVVLRPLRPPRAVETSRFRAAVKAAFAQRRKTLRNAWSKLGPPDEVKRRADSAGIDLGRRGETLTVEDFARFAEAE